MTATDTAAAALYVGGVEVTGTGAITGTGISGNVTFSYETGIGKALSRVPVLTLENATITEGYNVSTRIKAAIYADGITGLQIVLKGTNKLKVSSSSSSLNSTIGIALKDCGTVTMGNYAGTQHYRERDYTYCSDWDKAELAGCIGYGGCGCCPGGHTRN